MNSHVLTEVPPSGHLDRGLEGHGEERDEEVGEGEAHKEVVVDVPETPVEDDRDDDQHIVDDREEDDGEDDGDLGDQEHKIQVGLLLRTDGDVIIWKLLFIM